MAELLFFRGGELQMRAPVRGASLVVGRSADADFVLPDRSVSRVQCELVPRGAGWALVDRSGRGTPVSHRLAGEGGTLLKDGDEVKLGEFSIVYGAIDAPPDEPEITQPKRTKRGKTGPIGPEGSVERIRARLRLARPEGETTVPLRPEEGWKIVIGTDPEGSFQLEVDDRFVSAEHCRLAHRAGQWVVTDLKSRNGTWVNGVRVLEAILGPRAAIRIGETTLHFEQETGRTPMSEEPLPGLVTRDPAMAHVVDQVRRIAPSRVPVTIHGETGTGKEVVSRAVHLLSERRDQPFVALNCGALAKELIESELFGHEKGAFTGAEKSRAGAFEEADGGTLFLDEIGDLPLAAQVKLLRVLERGELRRLGGTRTQTVDVRMVSATHKDLFALVETGAFREDLYYRLCVASIELPPLRQRVGDIVPLAERFALQLAPTDARVTFSPSARAKLEGHLWPGNARELRNVVQLALLQRRGPVITDEDIVFRNAARRSKAHDSMRVAGRTLEEIEREAFRLALERSEGDRRLAMEELGVPRSTFFRKLEEFGLGQG